jgi:hypothetical protein
MASKVVSALHKADRWMLFGKCMGWTCMPMCCVGLACLAPVEAMSDDVDDMRAVVALYTEDTLHRLASLVQLEHEKFVRACICVNARTADKGSINSELTLLDAICTGMPEVGAVMQEEDRLFLFDVDKTARMAYKTAVFLEYVSSGGVPAVAVYGLPELVALRCDPMSVIAFGYYRKLVTTSQLRAVVMSFKAAAGF